jgi:hypothetical protein
MDRDVKKPSEKEKVNDRTRPIWPEDKGSQLLKKIFFSRRPLPMIVEPPDLKKDSKGEET